MIRNTILLTAAMFSLLVVGFVNAGSGPRIAQRFSSGGCASQQMYSYEAQASGGCCSQVMVQPAYKDCGCAGGRITLAERSTARRAARANFEKTMTAFLAAAEKGDLETAVEGQPLTAMKMVPIESQAACDCPSSCPCNCKSSGSCDCPKRK
jgi:hypothetical protein